MIIHDVTEQFRAALAEAGIMYEGELIADGQRHRFVPDGDRKENAVYQLWNDEHPAGWAKDYKRDIYFTWSRNNGRELTEAERRAWRERRAAIEAEREQAEAEFWADARARAVAELEAAKQERGDHPYLKTKGVGAHGVRSNGDRLYIPVRDSAGMLHGLQYIFPDGTKRFLAGTAVRGHYHAIGQPKHRILIAEGYATAATLHEITGEAVAVAFDCDNLKPVAEALRGKYPEMEIVICADSDKWTDGNPGLTKAREAGLAVGGKLSVPKFEDTSTKPTDFNDLARLEGEGAVLKCIEAAKRWPKSEPMTLTPITEQEIATAKLTPPCIVHNHLYADVGVFAGPGGTGKTTLALYEAIHITIGESLYGLDIKTPGAVLFITAEDSRELFAARIGKIAAAIPLTSAQRAEAFSRLFVLDLTQNGQRVCQLDQSGNIVLTEFVDQIIEACSKTPCVLVNLDPCTSFGAGERLVNDNENALIQAARKISHTLGCCVRYIHHVGKANARERTLDQYSARGGSALPDGTRMVSVLRTYSPEEDKITPPVGFRIGPDDQGLILARPKVSYCPPNQPNIWIKRTGYAFEYQVEIAIPAERELAELAAQVETYLVDQLRQGRYHTRHTLEQTNILPQKKLRQALNELIVARQVIETPLPEELRHGGRQSYLHPQSYLIKTADEVQTKKQSCPQDTSSVSTSSLPIEKRKMTR